MATRKWRGDLNCYEWDCGCLECTEGFSTCPEHTKAHSFPRHADLVNTVEAALDEHRHTDPVTGGQKGVKLAQLGAIHPVAIMEVAKVAGFGATKYARYNFLKGYNWSLSYDAMQRHLHAFWNREDIDKESGLLHLAHATWHGLALLAFVMLKRGTDDRPT